MTELLTVPALNQTWEQREQRIAMEAMTRTHKCDDCGGKLEMQLKMGVEELQLRCFNWPFHRGYARRRSYTEKLQAGEPVSLDIIQKIRKKRGA